jgi:hypothetical protein
VYFYLSLLYIGIHFSQYLNCSMFCEERLSTVNGVANPEYLSTYFFYLRHAAEQVGDVITASKSIASFLLLQPMHEIMNHHRDRYISIGVRMESFVPFKDFLNHLHVKSDVDILATFLRNLLPTYNKI